MFAFPYFFFPQFLSNQIDLEGKKASGHFSWNKEQWNCFHEGEFGDTKFLGYEAMETKKQQKLRAWMPAEKRLTERDSELKLRIEIDSWIIERSANQVWKIGSRTA